MSNQLPPRKLVYEIFVDRFAGDGGRALDPPPEGVDPWKHHAGGTLDGVVARLPHLEALGVDAIYLTPIFRAPSNHKYDTSSFDEIDPVFGGEPAFDRLATELRERGIGLILDGVFNHVGETHPWFQDAKKDPHSGRVPFFKFTRHPDEYARWRGFGFLPELDLGRDEVLAELFDRERAIVRRWIRRGATGWRLDCANDLGLSVCARARRAAKEEGALDGVLGEVMTYAEDWIANDRLDGVMNYYFRESVLGVLSGAVAPIQVAENFARMASRYRREGLLRSWNVLATHDTPRLATLIPDPRAQLCGMTLAFVYPGVPLVYYGEEIGLQGSGDPDNRRPMPWDESRWHRPTFEHVRRLAELRKRHIALVEGEYHAFPQPGAPELLAFARATDDPSQVVVVVANLSARPVSARVFAPYSFLFDNLPLVDLLGRAPMTRVYAGRFDLSLDPWQVVLFGPDDSTIEGYRFFKRR
jgi:glycosidase